MTAWSAMNPIQFDRSMVRTKKQREIARTAPDTLFPTLLPETKATKVEIVPELDGQDAMF